MSTDNDRQSDGLSVFWPTLLGSALLAIAIPWFAGGSQLDLRPALRVLLIGGAIAVLMPQLTVHLRPSVKRTLPLYASVLLLGVIWLSIGSISFSGFQILFALPIFSAAFISKGWLEYAVAAVTIAVATLVLYLSSTDFQWYLEQVAGSRAWLLSDFAPRLAPPFNHAESGGELRVSSLLTFPIAMTATAFLGSSVARALRRVERHLILATRSTDEYERTIRQLTESSTEIDFIVTRASRQVVACNVPTISDRGDANLETILDFLNPTFPEALIRLLDADEKATLTQVICSPGGVPGMFDVTAESIRVGGEESRRFGIRETPAANLAASAIDEFGLRIAAVGPDQRIVYASVAFRDLFPLTRPGTSVRSALGKRHGLPDGWWDIAPARRSTARFAVGNDSYTAVLLASPKHDVKSLTYLFVVQDPKP